jgi:glutamyl-tRNA synthetase
MSVVLRFAPSPTGYMHIGNARTALVNWLFARQHHGKFYLRFDDTDVVRSRPEYAQAIEADLKWLGWHFDEKFRQSDRLARYQEVVEFLIQSNHIYPCYETPEELDFKRKRQLAVGRPPVYDRAALKLNPQERQQLEAHGRKPHWRFLLKPEKVTWPDLAHGEITIDPTHLSDPILIREDGSPVYTLSSVVDDMDYGVTHIIRGNDHITNTAVQIQLWQALGKAPQEILFAHLPMITGKQGEALSKRLGSIGMAHLRDKGIEPLVISSYLARLGTSDEITIAHSFQELIDSFSIEKFAHSSPKFMMTELERLNSKFIRQLSYVEARERLAQRGLSHISQAFWEAVQGNLDSVESVGEMWAICYGEIEPLIDASEKNYLAIALEMLPPAPWDESTWRHWTTALQAQTGRKGRELFMPLRKALTAQEHGPEMQKILPFIGLEKARKRLQGQKA